VLSPFLLGKSAPPHALRIGLRLAGALVLAASLAAGLTAIARDLAQAPRSAPSAFSAEDLRQFRYVRERLADGEALLILATKVDRWHTCLWQRALYPRNPAIVRYKNTPASPQIEEDLRRFRIRAAVAFGNPPPDPGFRAFEEIGGIPASGSRVRFGPLSP